MTTLKQTPASKPATILSVDFKLKRLIDHECIPKRSVWLCDGCGSRHTHIDGADNNMPYIDIKKVVKLNKVEYDVATRICRDCGIQISEMFGEEN